MPRDEPVVLITPRSRRRPATRRAPVELTYAKVLALSEAGLRLHVAARRLGVCTTSFKRACRRLGLPQWGHYHARGDPTAFSRALALRPIHPTPFPAPVCEGGGTIDDLLARLDAQRPAIHSEPWPPLSIASPGKPRRAVESRGYP